MAIGVKLGLHNYLQLKFCSKKEKNNMYIFVLSSPIDYICFILADFWVVSSC